MTERWLVTGGCGFIGANLLPRLLARGARVRVLDDLSTGRVAAIDGMDVELLQGDVRDDGVVDRSMEDVDVVVHLAAHTRVVDSIAEPRLDFEVNVRGTLAVLEAARRRPTLRRFVLASTGGAILGDATPPVHEGMPARPLSPYGAAKLACEGYCSAYFASFGVPTVALRFSNVYGPGSLQKGSVVAVFLRAVLGGTPLVVHGDGQQTRDFLYVDDLCDAVLAAVERDCAGQVFHVASGTETAIGELAELIRHVTGAKVSIEHRPARRGEVLRNCASIARARRVLGYEPTVALEDGLRRTWTWFQTRS